VLAHEPRHYGLPVKQMLGRPAGASNRVSVYQGKLMVKYHVLSLVKDLGFIKSVIHPVLIESADGLILFDAGYPNQFADFETELKTIGFSISNISKIIISHHDHDHIGSLNDIKDKNQK
jgi:glyoxylase-like metal-dependent hydrolase (beta-lactamase superfamily II)